MINVIRWFAKPTHKIEDCPRCATYIGRGWLAKWILRRDLKNKGHIIFGEESRGKNIWQIVCSTKIYAPEVILNWHR